MRLPAHEQMGHISHLAGGGREGGLCGQDVAGQVQELGLLVGPSGGHGRKGAAQHLPPQELPQPGILAAPGHHAPAWMIQLRQGSRVLLLCDMPTDGGTASSESLAEPGCQYSYPSQGVACMNIHESSETSPRAQHRAGSPAVKAVADKPPRRGVRGAAAVS